jgi:hypothetical protein
LISPPAHFINRNVLRNVDYRKVRFVHQSCIERS